MKFKIDDIAKLCKGEIINNAVLGTVSAVGIDSRESLDKKLFIALKGQNFDGHDFIRQAIDSGVAAVLFDKDKIEKINNINTNGTALIGVKNSLEALKLLANGYRKTLANTKVIAVTGSNGKTTTKDLLACILNKSFKIHCNSGNRNNEIGLPLSVLDTPLDTEILVLEMATRGLGQINELCEIADPDWGIITNIGQSHLEYLGAESRVAKAKGELAAYLKPGGNIFLNADDRWTSQLSKSTKANVTLFGIDKKAHVKASNIKIDVDKTRFEVEAESRVFEVEIPLCGTQFIYSGLAAIAVSLKLGVAQDMIIRQLKNAFVSPMRMQVAAKDGITFINDAYNASPSSMIMALDTLAKVKSNRKIAVLGDMLELGKDQSKLHVEVGMFAGKSRLDYLITVGDLSRHINEGATFSGMEKSRVLHFNGKEEAVDCLRGIMSKGDVVLIKASRAMRFDKIVDELFESKAKW
jgi:UDP-N-acetylmuramoyl-tripeptide--D-alanyl-D-alanine ligase